MIQYKTATLREGDAAIIVDGPPPSDVRRNLADFPDGLGQNHDPNRGEAK